MLPFHSTFTNRLNGVVGTRKEQGQPPVKRWNKLTATSLVVPLRQNICRKQVNRVFSILLHTSFQRLHAINSYFAFNSPVGHAHIACNVVEPEERGFLTPGTFHKICEGRSNGLILSFVFIIWAVNPTDFILITLFIRLVRGSWMRLQC